MKQRLITIPEELLTDILPLIKNTPFQKKDNGVVGKCR